MWPNHRPNSKLVTLAIATFAIGCAVGFIYFRLERSHAIRELVHAAETAAFAFDADELRLLAGSPADANTGVYQTTKRRLQLLQRGNVSARYVYLFRASSPTQVVFLADSTTEGAPDESQPGTPYPEAADSPGLQEVLRTGKATYEGPLEDSFGVWVTGYARVDADREPGGTGAVQHILGIDIAAGAWNRNLWLAAAQGAIYTWLLLGFPLYALVTRRRQGEQREAIRNLSEAVEQSPSAIMIVDLNHRIEYVNRGLCEQLGYPRRELIGRHWRELIAGPDASATSTDLTITIEAGHTWEGDWINQTKDGREYPVHGRVTPVKQRDGRTACFVASFEDVTEVRRREAELREARDLAEAGDRAKGQFLATMSHEVRTPLNGIVGFTSLLLDTPLSPEQREFVHTIRASGEALIQLTADILDYARIESGKLKLDPIACDPREVIEEALDLHAAKAAEKGIELLHGSGPDVPSAVVVDGGRLRQVLVNLVGNAVKFTDRGEVEVQVRQIPLEARDGAAAPGAGPRILEFTVRDTGIGIAPEHQGRLFKPFSQVDETTTRRYGGAGLGLAICKNLVTLMGGAIEMTSVAGVGSTFRFTVCVPVAAAQLPSRDLDGMQVGLAVGTPALRRELETLLTSWDAAVVTAETLPALGETGHEVAVVELSEQSARELARADHALPGIAAGRAIAVVPISLPSELRSLLRAHFRFLMNRPLHHGALYTMLSGARPHATPTEGATQFGLRALVVEDNEVNQRLLLRVLAVLGCSGRIAANGVEALAELKEHAANYDLVLLDLHMPEMDGLVALDHIRRGAAGKRAQTMWIIALTADARTEQRERAFEAGLNDYLTKPLRAPELEAALHRFRADRMGRKG